MTPNVIYALKDLPVQQNRIYSSIQEAAACPRGSLALTQDPLTGIVHNAFFNPELIVYDESYQNEQGHSAVFRQHLEQAAAVLHRHFRGRSLLEIGCGKGTFLELLREQGFSATGIDPAYEGDAAYVIKDRFSASLGVTGDAIVLRHILEHIPDPLNFLDGIRAANGGKGLVYIESPCLEWIADHRAWFDIFYEHVNYFRLSDFLGIFGNVLESGRFFGGQYLYVVANLSTLGPHPQGECPGFRLPDDFLESLDRAIAAIKSHTGRKHVLWGASSKGVIFAHQLFQRAGVKPDFAIDINPVKQGKYLPVTGLAVLSPADALLRLKTGDAIFVMNSNYFAEIQSSAGNHFKYYRVDQNEL